MSSDEAALADLLETAGQRAEEIRVEIATLKEKTGNNAVTVPQLLKGDAFPDVTEPEAGRPDEPDGSLQFTVSTPSGERQAPPKTEDGTDTEDLDLRHHALDSPITVHYVRSSSHSSASRAGGEANWSAGGLTVSDGTLTSSSCDGAEAAAGQAEPGTPTSWQGLYQDMLNKLNHSRSMRQQCVSSSVQDMLKEAGMSSAADTGSSSSSLNVRVHQMATPFALDGCQAAAVAAGAITTSNAEDEAPAAEILPSPVIEGPYQEGQAPAAASPADAAGAGVSEGGASVPSEQWAPSLWHASQAEPGNKRSGGSVGHSSGGSSCPGGACVLYDSTAGGLPLVVPASAADLPVQAVLAELDELLSWSSRTPTAQQQVAGVSRFATREKTEDASTEAAEGAKEDLVARWLRTATSCRGPPSRRNSTSCLLSDEYMDQCTHSNASSDGGRRRRSSSVPPAYQAAPVSRGGRSGGGCVSDDEVNDKSLKLRQHQQSSMDLRDEIMAHLRLAAAFRPQVRTSHTSSMEASLVPGAPLSPLSGISATTQESPTAAAPDTIQAGRAGATLVDWVGVGKYIAAGASSSIQTGSSLLDIDDGSSRCSHSSRGLLNANPAAAAGTHASPALCAHLDADKTTIRTSFRKLAATTSDSAAAGDASTPKSVTEAGSKDLQPEESTSPTKCLSKSAQLYQKLLMRPLSASCSSLKSSAGGSGPARQQAGKLSSQSAGGCQGSPVRPSGTGAGSAGSAQGSFSAGGSLVTSARGRWPSPDPKRRHSCSVSPVKHRPHAVQLPDCGDAVALMCTTCGSPVRPPGSSNSSSAAGVAKHTRMSLADLTEALQTDAACTETMADEWFEAGEGAVSADAGADAPVATFASLSALLGGGDDVSSSRQGANSPAAAAGPCTLCMTSTQQSIADMSPSKSGRYASALSACSSTASRRSPSPRRYSYAAAAGRQQGSGYAAAGRQQTGTSIRQSRHGPAGRLTSRNARPAGPGAVSIPGAAAAAAGVARVTAISCGQLLQAAALEQALGRVSATSDDHDVNQHQPGSAGAAVSGGSVDEEAMLEQELQALEAALPGTTAAAAAGDWTADSRCNMAESSSSQQQAQEGEGRVSRRCSSAGKAANVFVYRLQPTNDASNDATGNSTTAAAAAAAAMQTLAACASRQDTRSLSPSRMGSSKSLAAASKRSSSSGPPSRPSQSPGVSRTSSVRSKGSSVPSSSSSSRVWRPGGQRTSAKDDCRKLQAYESARRALLGPVPAATSGGTDVGTKAADTADAAGAAGAPAAAAASPEALRGSSRGSTRPYSPTKQPGKAATATQAGKVADKSAGAPGKASAAAARAAAAARVAAAAKAAAATAKPPSAAFGRSATAVKPGAAGRAARAAAAAAEVKAAAGTAKASSNAAAAGTHAQAKPEAPEVQEQGVQADFSSHTALDLPEVGNVVDTSTLLDELKAKSKPAARRSTPGRLQTNRVSAAAAPMSLQLQQALPGSPTITQVEEAIKAAQIALLQRRWQISQLRKAMAAHGVPSSAGTSGKSSSLNSSGGAGLLGLLGGSSTGSSCAGKYSSSSATRLSGLGGDVLSEAAAAAAAVQHSEQQGLAAVDEHPAEAASSGEQGGSYASQAAAAAALLKLQGTANRARLSSAADSTAGNAAVDGSNASSPKADAAAPKLPQVKISRNRPASALDGLLQLERAAILPLRPSSAQAVVTTAAHKQQAPQQHYTASYFATLDAEAAAAAAPAAGASDAAAAPPVQQQQQQPLGMAPGRTSRLSETSPNLFRRRSSISSPFAEAQTGSAGGMYASCPPPAGLPAPPPWSAPRRVSSSGMTGDQLMAFYRRSSAAEAAEAAAEGPELAAAACRLQLDTMLRAYNALSKRKNSVDKSAALAALMANIVAVAAAQTASPRECAAYLTEVAAAPADGHAEGEPTSGSEAQHLLDCNSPEPDGADGAMLHSSQGGLGVEGSRLDVLGRRVSDGAAGSNSSSPNGDSNLLHSLHKQPGSHAAELASHLNGMPAEALAAAAPEGNGIVIVHSGRSSCMSRLPLLKDTATGRAVLAGIDGTSLNVQQAVHWLKVGLTRIPNSHESAADANPEQQQRRRGQGTAGSRAGTPHSPNRPRTRTQSRPCSPFRCFAPAEALSDEEDMMMEQELPQQQQQDGVQFEMDANNQLVMVVPQHLTPNEAAAAAAAGQPAAAVHKYTVTGLALPEGCSTGHSADDSPGSGSSGSHVSHCLELVTCAGRHRIELASERDWAGLLAGLNAMLLLREQAEGAGEKLGGVPIAETAWSTAVEGIKM